MPFPRPSLKIIRTSQCQPPPPAISISPAPAISAISAAIPRATAGPCAGGRSSAPTISAISPMTTPPCCGSSASAARSTFAAPRSAPPPCAACLKSPVHSLPVEPTVVAALRAIAAAGTPLSTDHAVEVMRGSYSGYVQNNTQHFRTLFAHLLEDRAPLVIHCTAGKDRTGFACALILHTLGVSEDIISEDYLLTNRFYRRDPNHSSDLPDDIKQVLGSVQDIVPRRRVRGHRRRLWRSRNLSPRWPRSRQSRTRPSRSALSAALT